MPFNHAYVLPILEGLWYPITFITTYTIATLKQDVPAVFPYISDTGAWSIEKCIFSFMMVGGALLMSSVLYIRYRQVKELIEDKKEAEFSSKLASLNTISIYLASLSMIGLVIVGCFQVWPYIYMHLLGAGSAFTFGWLVIAIQTYISFQIFPLFGSKLVNIVQAILVIISGVALLLVGIFGGLSLLYFKGDDVTQWTKDSGGFEFHLVSSISEWILALGVIFHLALYYKEFKDVVLHKPKIQLVNV